MISLVYNGSGLFIWFSAVCVECNYLNVIRNYRIEVLKVLFSYGSDSELQYSEQVETVEVSGGKVAEKKGNNGKKKAQLTRQDTFVLISPSMPKKSSQRAKVVDKI